MSSAEATPLSSMRIASAPITTPSRLVAKPGMSFTTIGVLPMRLAITRLVATTPSEPIDDATDETTLRAALLAIKLRDADAPNPVPVSAIFRDKLGGALENERLQAAIGALLKQIAEIDVDVLLDQRPLDVHLRESLRLAADWAREHHAGKIPASAATP